MIPNGEKIVEENHDENKINVNRDFIKSNVGWKNDMKMVWIACMYFKNLPLSLN